MSNEVKNIKKRVPHYLRIYTEVRNNIINGIYPYGTKLPSKRNMAEKSFVSTLTVEHAYELLCDEGYVESKERSGYFVIFHTDDAFASSLSYEHIKPTSYENNDESSHDFPFSVLTKAMRSVINDFGERILERSPNIGTEHLRKAISQYLARSRGILVTEEQIIIGAGSEYLYGIIIELLGRDKIYAVESPSYKKIAQVYEAADVKCEFLALGSDGIKTTELKESCADILHISPYRSYPSGVTASASKRHEYIRWASAKNRYIIEDDFESEFSISKKNEETLFSLSHKNNVIYMNTFSKTLSPSLRVGYAVLPNSLLKEFHEKIGFYSCTVSTYIQLVLSELITSGDFERHINRVRRKKRNEKQGFR